MPLIPLTLRVIRNGGRRCGAAAPRSLACLGEKNHHHHQGSTFSFLDTLRRCLSDDSKKGGSAYDSRGKTDSAPTAGNNDHDDDTTVDLFGNYFQDGDEAGKVGPMDALPPNYVRDATTGRMTGQVRSELSQTERDLLSADTIQQDAMLAERIEKHLSGNRPQQQQSKGSGGEDGGKQPANALSLLGERVRKAQKDLNVFGRSPTTQAMAAAATEEPEEETEAFAQRLTPEEMKEFRAYMKKHHKVDLSDDDMPVLDTTKISGAARSNFEFNDDTDWAIQWRTEQAQRQMDDFLDDNPYADIMPQDLSKSALVNRKKAKPLPRELLSHNNVSLLQSFMTETGQIKSRVQTRLGARDQRKVAKLVKRARALGLVPYQGPFRVEQHGWIHDPTLQKKRPWEVEMERRGLTLGQLGKEQTNSADR